MGLFDSIADSVESAYDEAVTDVKAVAGYIGLSKAVNGVVGNAKESVTQAENYVERQATAVDDYLTDLPETLYYETVIKTGIDEKVVTPLVEKAKEAVDTVEKKKKQVLTLLDVLTNPWVLGGAAVVVTLAVLGPYVLPFWRKP